VRGAPQKRRDHPGLFGSNPGRLVKAVFEAKGSSAGGRG
jgi:hypothetical protein